MIHYSRVRIYKIFKGKLKYFKLNDVILFQKEDFINNISSKFQEGMNWDNHGEWHIDHIKPISSFNLNNIDELKICWSLDNLNPLWAIDNLRKGANVYNQIN